MTLSNVYTVIYSISDFQKIYTGDTGQNGPDRYQCTVGENVDRSLQGLRLSWSNIKEISDAFSFPITLFSNHLR